MLLTITSKRLNYLKDPIRSQTHTRLQWFRLKQNRCNPFRHFIVTLLNIVALCNMNIHLNVYYDKTTLHSPVQQNVVIAAYKDLAHTTHGPQIMGSLPAACDLNSCQKNSLG